MSENESGRDLYEAWRAGMHIPGPGGRSLSGDPTVALERIKNLHKPCHAAYGYMTEGVCDGHAVYGPAACLGCGKPSPCPTLCEVEAVLRPAAPQGDMWTPGVEADGERQS